MEGDQRKGRPENREINAGHMKSRRVRGEKDKGKKEERVGGGEGETFFGYLSLGPSCYNYCRRYPQFCVSLRLLHVRIDSFRIF